MKTPEEKRAYDRERAMAWINKNREKKRAYSRAWNARNRERCLQKKREWYYNNREYAQAYHKQKLATDPSYRIGCMLRHRTNEILFVFKGKKKSPKTEELIGCTQPEFRAWVESKFLPGMTWENHGPFGWHIDHIKPCASFDLTDPEQRKLCFHYTNVQPLWWKDNISKGDRIADDSPMNQPTLKPLHDRILFDAPPKEIRPGERMMGGVVVPANFKMPSEQPSHRVGKVIAIGDACKSVKVGDTIVTSFSGSYDVAVDGVVYPMVDEKFVLAVVG